MSIETENGTELISDQYGQMMFQGLTVGASERRAKISALQESGQGLTETEAALCERFSAFAGKKGKISPNGLSMRTLRECYQATEDLTSLPFCLKWTNWGTIANGLLSTASITEYPRTGKECILLDTKEVVDKKIFFL